MNTTHKQRNTYIDFLRVLFCIFICLYHWNKGHFGGGYLGVDFFFILSGFYMMQGFENNREELAKKDIYLNVGNICGSASAVFIHIILQHISLR